MCSVKDCRSAWNAGIFSVFALNGVLQTLQNRMLHHVRLHVRWFCVRWLSVNKLLNVSGNSVSTYPEIFSFGSYIYARLRSVSAKEHLYHKWAAHWRLAFVFCLKQWRTEGGGFWWFNPPAPEIPKPSKIVPNSIRLWKLLKIAEFRAPTPQDVRKKGSKILELPRFAIVLH